MMGRKARNRPRRRVCAAHPCEGAVVVEVAHAVVAIRAMRRARWAVDAAGGAPAIESGQGCAPSDAWGMGGALGE